MTSLLIALFIFSFSIVGLIYLIRASGNIGQTIQARGWQFFTWLQSVSPLTSPTRLIGLIAVLAALYVLLPASATVQASVAAGYSEFYLAGSSDQLFALLRDNDNNPEVGNATVLGSTVGTCSTAPCNRMHSVVTIVIATDNTRVYYDHWENGYGTANTGNDEVYIGNAGDVLVFESSNIIVPRTAAGTCTSTNPTGASTTCYDGRDRIYAAGGAIGVAQAFWPEVNGTVYANAWEIYPIKPYQSSYVVPVGEDLFSAPRNYADFKHVYVLAQATADNTVITIDDPQVAGVQVNVTLNRGETTQYFHAHTGTTITGSHPIQVQFIAGQDWTGVSSDTRSYTAVPNSLWDTAYYSPVPSANATTESDVYIYNPTLSNLVINYQDRLGSGTITVPANSTRSYSELVGRLVPTTSAIALTTADGTTKFWAIGSYDTENADYNFGFSLIPAGTLADNYYIGWSPGTTTLANNGSPVFVTATQDNTVVFVDYSPTDGVVDATYVLDRVEVQTIRDLTDNNNTGMHIWATAPIALVWGEDDTYADIGNPYIDAGYAILPLRSEWIDIVVTLDKTSNPTSVLAAAGQVSEFTLTFNAGSYGLNDVYFTDVLPTNWAYIPGSTTITWPSGSSTADPTVTGSNLAWGSGVAPLANLLANQTLTIVYRAQTTGIPPTYSINAATGTGTYGSDTFSASDSTTVATSLLSVNKISSAGGTADPGDTLTYTITISNIGGSTQNNIVVRDALPAGTTYVAQSTAVTGTNFITSTYLDQFGSAAYNNSNGTAAWGSTPWVESGADAAGNAGAGTTLITGGRLRFDGAATVSRLTRPTNLTGASSAILMFDDYINGTIEAGDVFTVEVSSNGGSSWTTLESFDGTLTNGSRSYDISPYANANTQIRFSVTGFTQGTSPSDERMELDNVQIQFTTPSGTVTKDNIVGGVNADLVSGLLPTLVTAGDNFDLPVGGTMTVTYRVTISDPVPAGQTSVINTAQVSSDEQPIPVSATISDTINLSPNLAIAKTPDTQIIQSGDAVTFTVTVTNTGAVTLTNVAVGDPLTSACDRNIGTLVTGAVTSYTCSLVNVTADFTNTALVTGTPPVGAVVTDTDDAVVDVTVPAFVSGQVREDVDGDGSFADPDSGINGVTIVLFTDPNGDGNPADGSPVLTTTTSITGSYVFTNVLPGNYVIVETDLTGFTSTADTDAPNDNYIGVTVTSGVDSTGNDFLDAQPDIAIAKTPDVQTVVSGSPVTFTITVTNTGAVTLTNVTVGDPLASVCDRTIGTLATGAFTSYTCTRPVVTIGFTNTAVVTGTPPTGPVITNTDTARVEAINPAIAIAKTPDSQTIVSGSTVTFTLTVTNTGDVTLTNVTVADPLAAGCDATIGTLATGAITSYDCSVLNVTADFTNAATVTGTPPAGPDVSDTDDAAVDVINPAISLAKTPDTQTIQFGSTVTFTITVTNTGDVNLSGVIVGDTLAPACDRTLGVLATGAITSYTCSLANVTADFTNTAVVTGTPPVGSVVTGTDDAQVEVINPAITIAKTPDLQTITSGDTVTFTITVSNTGDADLSSVVVGDVLAPACSRTIGTLATGAITSYTCSLLNVTADFTNTAIVTGTPPTGPNVSDTDDAVVNVVSPGLVVDKSVALAAVVPNQAVTYTIRVTNTGNITLTTVEIRDTLPIGFVYVPNTATPVPDSTTNGQLIWNDITGGLGLGPGQPALVNFKVTMPVTVSTYINTAVVTGTYPGGVLTTTDSVPVIVSDPAVVVEKNQVAPGVVNGLITFTIHITNTGPSTIDQMPLVDHFTGPIVYIGGAPAASTVDNTNQIIAWSDLTAGTANGFGTDLAPNQSFVITTVFSITASTSSFTMTNAATVTNAVDVFSNGANDDSDTEVLINIPTAIDLLYFTSSQEGQGVRLNWATAVEYDNYGFRLLRSSNGSLTDAIDVAFLPGQGHGTVAGTVYTYLDQSVSTDQTYTYWLVDVDFNGVETVRPLTTAIRLSAGSSNTYYLPLIFK